MNYDFRNIWCARLLRHLDRIFYLLLNVEPPDVLMVPMVGAPIYDSFDAPLRSASSLPLRLTVPLLAPLSMTSAFLTDKSANLTRLAPEALTSISWAEPSN